MSNNSKSGDGSKGSRGKKLGSYEKAAHRAPFHENATFKQLKEAHDELEPVVLEAETALRSCLQLHSELPGAQAKLSEREKEDRCLQYYGWVLRLEATEKPLQTGINRLREALAYVQELLASGKEDYALCQLLLLNSIPSGLLLKRALAAFSQTPYGIRDATFSAYLAQLLSNRAQETFEWLNGVPVLPVARADGTEVGRLLASLLTALENVESGGVCVPIHGREAAAGTAARMMRDLGWNAFIQDRFTADSPPPGLQVNTPRKQRKTTK